MMDFSLFILIFIVALLIILGVFFIILFYKKRDDSVLDYYALFIMGFVWFAIGFPLKNPFLCIMGAIFFIIGLFNKRKWKKNKKDWKKITKKEKKQILISIVVLAILAIAGIIFYFWVQSLNPCA